MTSDVHLQHEHHHDPTFYRSPADAAAGPPERLAYVAAFSPLGDQPDAIAVVDTDPARAARLAADAEAIARSYTSEGAQGKKAIALANLSRLLAHIDPDHAGQLVAEAERAAESIKYEEWGSQIGISWKDRELSRVAQELASSDPDRAERIARSITHELQKYDALGAIVKMLVRDQHDEPREKGRGSRYAEDIQRHLALRSSGLI